MGSTVAPADAEHGDFAGRAAKDGFVMAVAVNQNVRTAETAGEQSAAPASASQSASSQTCWLRRSRAGIVGKEFQQLVFEDAGTTWLEKDEGQAGLDLRWPCGRERRAK